MPRRWLPMAVMAVAVALSLWPDVAAACPVCFDPREESRMGFLLTTAFLTLLPLSLLGGTIYWFVRKARSLAAEELAVDTVD